MAVKVGVSLWTMATDQQRPAPREATAQGFDRKLGLRDNPEGSADSMNSQPDKQTLSQQQLTPASFSRPDLMMTRRSDSSQTMETMTAGVLELYALGARAGHHLSYSPQSFLAAQADDTLASPEGNRAATALSGEAPRALFVSSDSSSTLATLTAPSQMLPTVLEAEGLSSVSQSVLSYLTSKWPARNFQLLPRGKGLELLVRDYHLSPQERDELVGELSRLALLMPERPQQIWLNGQSVWQLSSFLNDFQGEPHGR